METTLFVCTCGDISHQFVISEFDDDQENLYISIHLSNVGFWNRLKYAFYYILGKKSRYNSGAFAEVILNKNNINELSNILKKYNKE